MESQSALFARHLSIAAKVCIGRDKAKEDLQSHIAKMRRKIISMSLSYSDIDSLKLKIDALVNCEKEYAKLFKTSDGEASGLKSHINELEEELRKERLEKKRLKEDNHEKISQLSESLESVKSQLRTLLIEKSKKTQKMLALEKKIHEKAEVPSYYSRN